MTDSIEKDSLKSEKKSRITALLSSPNDMRDWLTGLSEAYSAKLMWMLGASQFVHKGFVMGYALGAFDWLLRERNVPGPRMQVYQAIGMLPFAMKPLIGMLSDAFPICGYQKNPYIFLSTLVGLVGMAIIVSSGWMDISVKMLTIGLFCIVVMISSSDVLTEAKYAEKIRAVPERGPDLITFVWVIVTLGGFCATVSLGAVLEVMQPNWVYAICFIPASIILIPTFLNYLDERKIGPDEVVQVREDYFGQWELVCLVCLVGVGSIIMMVTGLVQESVWVNLAVGLTCGFIIMCAFLLLTAPIIGKFIAFCIIQHVCAFNTMGASFYFFTDGPKEYPAGPHFSPWFMMSVLGVLGSIFSLFGFSIFNLYMKHWRYHSVFLTTNFIFCCGHGLSAIQYARLNVSWGISDEFFALAYSMITSVTMSMVFLPGIVLLTQLCPKQVEATMYALLAGTSNLGTQIGSSVGACVLQSLDITPRGAVGESAKFDNLWIAALLSSVAPMLTLILIPWMIPNALQTERLMDANALAVDGSPLRRFLAWRKGETIDSACGSYGATSA